MYQIGNRCEVSTIIRLPYLTFELMFTEEALITSLISKDTDAVIFAYKKYGPAIYGFIHSHHITNVDTIFIRTFTKIINTIDKYDSSKCRLFTWMYNIVLDEINKG